MDISKGIVEIDNELVVKPNFTFEQFKETKYYTNQDGIRIIYLDEPQIIKNRKYIVSLFFRSVYKELHADHETGAADNK